MANVYFDLPCPAANGAGAWVNVSQMGFERTITVGGTPRATINVEISNENPFQDHDGAAVATFLCPDDCDKTVACAAQWMRCVVSNYKSGTPTVQVGGNDDGIGIVNLDVPAGNGVGIATDVSALGGVQKTAIVQSEYRGSVIIEISEDNVTWAQGPVFVGGGSPTVPRFMNFIVTAKFMRVRRSGVPTISPGLPVVGVGIISDVTVPPSFSDPELIRYSALGTEGSQFTVVLANPRADAEYFVAWMSQDRVAVSGITKQVVSIPRTLRTATQFVVNVSAPVEVLDQFEFLVVG